MRRSISAKLIAVILLGEALTASSASAITVELAKKCRAYATKMHPTVLAGSKTGSAKAQRDVYLQCLDGKISILGDQQQQPKQ